MYEELVRDLRNWSRAWGEEPNPVGLVPVKRLAEAADAIEELSKPRWIPVTERLPEKNQIVVAHEGKGTWDFGMFRGISASGNPEYWHWKKNTFKHVKWWMPKDGALPEPPKEEE